ncbi:MAG: DUF3892 domain-containing protein [Rhodospirillales bacterium]|nr:DUF3892 domain-containing protein [Rhodospirillales bacterium]
MAQDVEIKCIRKTDRTNPHERIRGVGGVNADGSRWYMLLDRAIALALDGTYRYWTRGGGKSVWVHVAYHSGRPYLKTDADGVQPDNLLALPECP